LTIVNVMPKSTFDDGHIPESINLPLADIDSSARRIIPDLAQEMAIYCAGPT
jgi:rhodanese-related sulfurtransferase